MTPDELKEYKRNWYHNNKEGFIKYRENNKEKISEYQKQYYEDNKDQLSDNKKKYYEDNRESLIEKSKKYAEENKDSIKEYKKEYRLNNIDKINDYAKSYNKEKRDVDILYKMKGNIRSLIGNSIRRSGYGKKSQTHNILGSSFEDFLLHLETNFEDWMSWENYGLYNGELNCGWDIDHVIPYSSANTEEEIISLNHYSNLLPLCSKMNRDIKKNNL